MCEGASASSSKTRAVFINAKAFSREDPSSGNDAVSAADIAAEFLTRSSTYGNGPIYRCHSSRLGSLGGSPANPARSCGE